MTINAERTDLDLFEIDFIPKGKKTVETVSVRAKNRLDASNQLIYRKMWGKQIEVRYCNINLLKNK